LCSRGCRPRSSRTGTLGLPAAVPDLPAFHHLSRAPVERFGLLPMTALVGLGLLAAAAGVAAF